MFSAIIHSLQWRIFEIEKKSCGLYNFESSFLPQCILWLFVNILWYTYFAFSLSEQIDILISGKDSIMLIINGDNDVIDLRSLIQGWAKVSVQLWVCERQSLFLCYYLLIIVLFSTLATNCKLTFAHSCI